MDTDLYPQSHLISSLPTIPDLTQGFSPTKIKHQASYSLQHSCASTQPSNDIYHNDSDIESPKSSKKPVFTIVRESSTSPNLSVPLNKDFGNYNRKEKSLGELSKRLLIMFGRVDQCVISLDVVTQQLGVERRRIYDIINILESLGVVYRKGKNSYQWKGLKSIYETITQLQNDHANFDEKTLSEDLDSDDESDTRKPKSAAKREKSLGLLSTGFIKLFLSWKGTISLEQAGRKLSSNNIEENKIKTKIRRLYDIANVFSSVGLIKKTCLESKKPAYEWVGLPGLDAFINRLNTLSDERDIFLESKTKIKEKTETPKFAEKQAEFNLQSDKSAFKHPENAVFNTGAVENLLNLLMNISQIQPHEQVLSDLLLKLPSFEMPKLLRQASSPGSSMRTQEGFVTPNIRKSVSIIQQIGDDTDTPATQKKQTSKTTGFVLSSKKSSFAGIKREPIQNLEGLEVRNSKKIPTFSQLGRNGPGRISPSNLLDKENSSSLGNSELNESI